MAPKVLVSDKLSPTAVQIFRDRGIGHIGLEEQVPVSIGQFPAHFIRPGIGLDDDGEGVLALTILGQNVGRKQQGEREEYSAHEGCLGGR